MDCKEIQLVYPKGDQSWVFTGKTDVEAETPILWSPDEWINEVCSDSSVQSLSRIQLFATPRTAARQASLSITNSQSLLKSCPLSQGCHPAISSSVIHFSSFPQSFPASVQFSSVTQSCPTLSNSMNCSTSGLPVHHQLLEFTQTHILSHQKKIIIIILMCPRLGG